MTGTKSYRNDNEDELDEDYEEEGEYDEEYEDEEQSRATTFKAT